MAGIIGNASLNKSGLIGDGLLGTTYAGSLDDLTAAGVYQITTTTTSKPTGISDGIVIMLSNEKIMAIGTQLAFGGGGKMFYRYKWLKNWSTWYLVTAANL